jgi:hypothetical protein
MARRNEGQTSKIYPTLASRVVARISEETVLPALRQTVHRGNRFFNQKADVVPLPELRDQMGLLWKALPVDFSRQRMICPATIGKNVEQNGKAKKCEQNLIHSFERNCKVRFALST